MSSPSRVLVTGGAGYIGSHTVVQLLDAGSSVVVVDNLANADPIVLDRIREIAELGAGDDRLEFHQVDLRDRDALDAVVAASGAEAVVHFAGRKSVAESVREPLLYYQHNVIGSLNLVDSMIRHGLRTLVFSSSATVYGAPQQVPVGEDAPRDAINPYGRTKAMVEQVLADVAAADPSWRIVALRYFNPVGAHASGRIGEDPTGVPENLVPFVMQVAVGLRPQLAVFGDDYDTPDGTCIRDYVHVVDLADAHLAALAAAASLSGFDAVNIGTGSGTSVFELVATTELVTGVEVPRAVVGRRAGDAAVSFADVTRARELLGWEATRGIDDMVADHWRWQSRNPTGYRP